MRVMVVHQNAWKTPSSLLDSLQRVVSNYAISIKAKAVGLRQSFPASKAEQDKLNKEKVRKLKKAELDVKHLVSKIDEFKSKKDNIKPSRDISDHDVINLMFKLDEWK